MKKTLWQRLDKVNVAYFIFVPILTFFLLYVFLQTEPLHWKWILMLVVGVAITNMSITVGYHRYFSHLSFSTNPFMKVLFLLFGAGAIQGSALEWGSDHRRHHKHVDTDLDPYNINRGFWYAHLGWILLNETIPNRFDFAKDLKRDPWVKWQHDHYFAIAIFMAVVVPTLIGWAMGSALGGLVFGAGLRLFFSQHFTFFINSLCHTLGRRPYTEQNSARDSILMAVCTFGEGYHNYHHKFQADYRNGIRWYHWDPSKWTIYALSKFKLAGDLRRTPAWEILKARLSMEEMQLIQSGVPIERFQALKEKVEEAQKRWRHLYEEYMATKESWIENKRDRVRALRRELKRSRRELQLALEEWQLSCRILMAHA